MKGRVAVVTGGTRGIGEAISQALKEAHYQVAAIFNRDESAAEAFEKQYHIPTFQCDVGKFESCTAAVNEIEGKLGPIAVLVNNAGITRDGMFHKMAPNQWGDVITTNLNSCFNMTRAVIEGMREHHFGRIINISSINGQKGQMGQTNYSAAKAGVIGFTKALAQESASRNITVNAIAPGYIHTDMVASIPDTVMEKIVSQIPVGRLGTAEEIARAVVFLASDKAGFMTGSTLSLNGGQYFA